ncbi:hypothetical protein O8C85_09360 [Aliarcobacter butzleri]|uniref:DUF6988 family protein n=1 Tax=Aliarcobacter butzleri TaxID=28197 RepID=UPI00263E9944|nr:hypothetical protein [Aliarcobacter butzleri]MDN5098740.1 hypothetical protein [Aliarcobacter butzleri]
MNNYENEIKELYEKMIKNFSSINSSLKEFEFESENEYKKINNTYFLIIKEHYKAFLLLIGDKSYPSAFVLARTILETFVKSMYLEYIGKPKNKSVNNFLIEKNKFPSLFDMAKKLEAYTHPSGAKFDGFFKQFLKEELATYEKLSFLSHSRGKYIQKFYEQGSVDISSKDIHAVMNFMNRMFISSALFHLFIFEYLEETKKFTMLYQKDLISQS